MPNDLITRRSALSRLIALAVLPPIFGKPRAESGKPLLGKPRAEIDKPFPHPDPRPGITGEHVLAEDKLPDRKAVRDAFDAARTYPEIFDGVYCPCECHDSMNHRSLLSCFETTQPIGCMGCRDTGEEIAPLAKAGKTLAEIREHVDKRNGRG